MPLCSNLVRGWQYNTFWYWTRLISRPFVVVFYMKVLYILFLILIPSHFIYKTLIHCWLDNWDQRFNFNYWFIDTYCGLLLNSYCNSYASTFGRISQIKLKCSLLNASPFNDSTELNPWSELEWIRHSTIWALIGQRRPNFWIMLIARKLYQGTPKKIAGSEGFYKRD